MGAGIYGALQQLGYNHPLHPVVVHLPVGLVIAVVIFSIAAMFLRSGPLAQTARHCTILALLAAPVAAGFGLLDWLHFYGGIWKFPFIAKMVLAGLLIVSLAVAVFKGLKKDVPVKRLVPIYLFSFVMVVGLGYFGGELVYGTGPPKAGPVPEGSTGQADRKDAAASQAGSAPGANDTQPAGAGGATGKGPDAALVEAGRTLFNNKCSFCHYTDSTETKVGPGLKGIFNRKHLPVSGWPATEASVRRQLKTPFDSMPPFPDLSEKDVDAIISFLKTL